MLRRLLRGIGIALSGSHSIVGDPMLRIHQNRSAAGAKSYYSRADYYSEGHELVGQWGGRGAKQLGLTGEVQQRDFDALCDNLDPRDGRPLSVRTKTDRTVLYDFNWHVPKGVSLAFTLNRDERILAAFRTSVQETMEELESEAKTRVRTAGRNEERVTGNLVWATFVHTTARPVEGLSDPHLHAHCCVFNQTFDQVENRFKAAQFRDLKRDAPYWEAAFHTRFAQRLQGLGYEIERQGRGWDLAGISESLKTKFSRRTDQIEALARKKGITDPEQKAELGARTREAKRNDLPYGQLRTAWQERLAPEECCALHVLQASLTTPRAPLPEANDQALAHAILHSFERNSVLPEKRLLAAALNFGVGWVSVDGMRRALAASDVIVRDWAGQRLATTRAVLAEEQAMLDFARQGRNRCLPLNANWRIQRTWLSEEQQAAVTQLLTRPDRVQILRGGAGTGKTSLMQELAAGIAAGGKRVLAVAPSASASRGVLRSEGFERATTIAELLVNQNLQAELQGQVLLVDEAGLVGTRSLKRVFDLAAKLDARVILAGDWRQHSSPERGAALQLLETQAGLRPAQVSRIIRQQGAYRAAVAELARGNALAGFDALDQLGWVEELPEAEREQRIAQAYADAVEDKVTALVVSPTHREGEGLVTAIRSVLKERNLLGAEDRTLLRLRPLQLTEAERADPCLYEPGDVLCFHQHVPGHKKGSRFTVQNALPEELSRYAARFSVYRRETLSVARGELVRVTANGQTADGHRLHNGNVYQVAGFSKTGDLRLANGWIVPREFGHLASGLVSTSHGSQGRTVDRVLISESAESFAAASREQFYVSVSRGRHQATIFTDDASALREAVERSEERLSATELVTARQARAMRLRRQFALRREATLRPSLQPAREFHHERA
jgi:conjugative relaxase-like TrwC/TraI family protein